MGPRLCDWGGFAVFFIALRPASSFWRKSRLRRETPEFNHAAGISANPENVLVGVADYTAEIGFSLTEICVASICLP